MYVLLCIINISAISLCAQYQKVVTDDVLLLSKLELQKIVVANVPFKPKLIIDAVTAMFRNLAGKKGIALTSKHGNDNLTFISDPKLIQTILINLVWNVRFC
jgi:signal transduction histidine kinase